MEIDFLKDKLHPMLYLKICQNIQKLRPAQEKAVDAGLLEGENILVCTPTASGKTLIAELVMLNNIYNKKGKAIYVVPLKALAREKYKHFAKYENINVAVATGDVDSNEKGLGNYDIIITTSEKLDSLLRHHCPWLRQVSVVVIDEVHLLNDAGRGPTLEILITMMNSMLKAQMISLSATIGNAAELADWLKAKLIEDEWRPVVLKKGVMFENEIEFHQ
ncbi:MAG: DEAD/DEAH box helicase [Nanoarchaeota archaeon]